MSAMPNAPAGAAPELPPHLQRQIWRGNQLSAPARGCLGTGHAGLDRELPGGGWPRGALTEVLTGQPGIGEMRLLAHALRIVTAEAARHVLLVGPPYMPYAPALQAWGIALERLIWVRAGDAQALWAAEQGLKHAGVGAVLMWLPAVRGDALRRLQVAAQGGNALAFVLRGARTAAQSSPAPLRLLCEAAVDQARGSRLQSAALRVDIIKRRGPPLAAPLLLHLPLAQSRVTARQIWARERIFGEEGSHVVDSRGAAAAAAGGGAPTLAVAG